MHFFAMVVRNFRSPRLERQLPTLQLPARAASRVDQLLNVSGSGSVLAPVAGTRPRGCLARPYAAREDKGMHRSAAMGAGRGLRLTAADGGT